MSRLWTILVYLAGDNNLEAFGQRDLLEMKVVGSNDSINVVAQFDSMNDSVTRRYYLTRDRPLAADVVAEMPETNTGDPACLLDFIRWGLAHYPAERIALILWNHGSGWKDDDIYARVRLTGLTEAELPRSLVRSPASRGVHRSLFLTSVQTVLTYPPPTRAMLFDDTSQDFLDSYELKWVLDSVYKERNERVLDLIGFDACLMSMIEVAAQIGKTCDWLVGSQEIEPGDGWPYDRILRRLTVEPDMAPEVLACAIVDAYASEYTEKPSAIAVTQSAVRLTQVPLLVRAVSQLADSLIESLAHEPFYSQALMPALRAVPKFRDNQYVDLGQLAELLAQAKSNGKVQAAAREVVSLLNSGQPNAAVAACRIVAPQAASTQNARGFVRAGIGQPLEVLPVRGLSIYVPFLGPVSPAYAGLEFARLCTWGRFLEAFARS